MHNRRMLLVENDKVQREKAATALGNRGWRVDTAKNGKEALAKLRSPRSAYDVIVLDLRMPELSGEEVLERIQDEKLKVPPVIVLSAYLDEASRQKCVYLGAEWLLKKAYDPAHLHNVALAAAGGAPAPAANDTEFCENVLDYMVKRREAALRERLAKGVGTGRRFWATTEPVLVVARRWNSWYPSVFPVIGGAYAIVGSLGSARPGNVPSKSPVALIDPGFQFMKAFTGMGIPWEDLDCCVITHNHPDHMGGIYEFMAARHALGRQTLVLCSRACSSMLGDCAGYNLKVKELDNSLADLLPAYESGGKWVRVRVRGFDTNHEEIGRENSSQGLSIQCQAGNTRNSLEERAELVILGDTEYDSAQHRESFMNALCAHNVKVVVLHIGSSQLKQGTGKHLYLPGMREILSSMDHQLRAIKYRGRLLVLISEWGLEHATREQIAKVCGVALPGFNDFSPIVETVRFLQKELKKIQLLPADIGLVVGIESANIYLPGSAGVSPESVDFKATDEGLKYERK
jgi:CheY-like chemotaxis protein